MSFRRLREDQNIQHTGKCRPGTCGILFGADHHKFLNLSLCVCFFLVSLFSESFIISHAVHDCCGEGCPVCVQIQEMENFFRQLRSLPSQLLFSAAAILIVVIILKLAGPNFIPASSVTLKVKLNR
jgi:hypothetical protein